MAAQQVQLRDKPYLEGQKNELAGMSEPRLLRTFKITGWGPLRLRYLLLDA